MNIKEGDVLKAIWKDPPGCDPYHCFDGQLIVKKDHGGDNKLYLEDTYWGGCVENKIFTLEEAQEKFNLTFICNLNDVKNIVKDDLVYYDDSDIFDLSRQHKCYENYKIRKDAKRSKKKMLTVLNDRIVEAKKEITWQIDRVAKWSILMEKVENNELDVCI